MRHTTNKHYDTTGGLLGHPTNVSSHPKPPVSKEDETMKQTIEVLIYVNGECVLEEKLSEHHDELLDDSLFGEEYKSLSENDQLGWCLENIEDVVKGQMERMKKAGE